MEQFILNLENALERQEGSVKADDKFRDYEEWDSLAVLTTMAMIDENYDMTIPREDFEKCIFVSDLYNYIQNKTK
jgi:acyl carrier protein